MNEKTITGIPYYDGNGRTSWLLMNYIQAHYDLPLRNVQSENKAAYFQADFPLKAIFEKKKR